MYTKICMTTFLMDPRILDFPQAGCLKCSSNPIGDTRIFLKKKHDFLGGRVYKNYHPKTNSYVSHDYFKRKLHLLTIYFQGLCLVFGGVLFVLLVALFFGSLPNRLWLHLEKTPACQQCRWMLCNSAKATVESLGLGDLFEGKMKDAREEGFWLLLLPFF